MIDASSSMVRPFSAPTLRAGTGSQASFFTTVKAAERFVELRTQGKYKDLMALVEFGDQAYVITPFTTDYDNIRLSLSLIGDFSEFIRFPDQGTLLGSAVRQSLALFRAFDFLEASGNLMVLFSDGDISCGRVTAVSSARSCPTANGEPPSSRPADASTRPRTKTRSSRPSATSIASAPAASS
jgi:hypothetical protein